MIVDYIDAHKDEFGVEPICTQLQVAPSTYYAAKARPASARSVSDAYRLEVIRKVHADNYGVYGVTKVHAEVKRRGHKIARCTVHRLMRGAGLRGISRAKGPRTTIAAPGPDTRPDLVDRDFTATAPNQLWVADITYCRTFTGWVYAAFVVDVFSRRVVGWQLSKSLRTDLALDALEMGIWTRRHAGLDVTGLKHHSPGYRRGVSSESPLNPARDTHGGVIFTGHALPATATGPGQTERSSPCRTASPAPSASPRSSAPPL